MWSIEQGFVMLKLLLFIAGIVPETATIIHNAEQAWSAATDTQDKIRVIVAAVEDFLSKLRAAL
jgi:hypothetical protein